MVPPALLSHESTEHYTPQYVLDAVIACMGEKYPNVVSSLGIIWECPEIDE
jgi:hypothetical protein